MRNDVVVPRSMLGRLIGAQGSMIRDIRERSGAEVFICDKEGPPPDGEGGWLRLFNFEL